MRRPAGSRAVKVASPAAKGIRAGHPWVFRDSVVRAPEGLEPGALTRVADQEGNGLGWGIIEPEGAIAVRVVSLEEQFVWDDEQLLRRVEAASDYRAANLDDATATARRLIHSEGDGLPGLAVDRFGEYLLVYKYSRSAESYLDRLVPILESVFKPAGIYMQDRLRPVSSEDRRPAAFHLAGKPAPPEIEVEEDGLKFIVDVTAPVSPGLFLDLREGRRWLETQCAGKRVLNLFSFTGSFGLRAVRAGATTVTNIDAAARSHQRCRQNLQASGMDPEACEALVGDVFKHLERMRQRGRTFDFVVVDPPPFSRVKGRVFSALQHWNELMEAIVEVVEPGGHVLAVSNASRLTEEELMFALAQGAIRGGRAMRLTGERGLPADFPVQPAFIEGRYLRIRRLYLR